MSHNFTFGFRIHKPTLMEAEFFQQRAILAAVGRTAGIFSMLGAGILINDIMKDSVRRTRSKDRLLLLMSCCDFLFSFFGPILGALMIPADSIPGALGNQVTCDIQGFIYMAGSSASSGFNVSLAAVYLLIVKFNFSEDKLKKIEPILLYPCCYV